MIREARIAVTTVLVTAAFAVALSHAAPNPSGAAEKVARSATATGGGGDRELQTESAVFMGDAIRTDRAGEAQIRFVDDTRLVVGRNARVIIDRFVFRGGNTAETVTLSAVRGAFRFISGNSRKSAYRIRTPVMTIGVRGTGLDGYVEPGTGRTTIALYEGAAELCDAGGQCIEISEGCRIVVLAPGAGFQDGDGTTRALFLPYSISQASLLPDFRLDTSACGPAAPAFNSPSGSGGGGSRGGGPSGGGDGGGGGGDSDGGGSGSSGNGGSSS